MKIYKKSIVILVCSNMAGSEKYPLPFVSKRTHPLNFSNTGLCQAPTITWSCVGDMQDGIEFTVSLSLNRHDISEEDSTAFVDRCLTHPRLRKFTKCQSWVSFSANSLWPVDQGIIWAANRISQGALFWDCCKNWSQMKTSTDCPCMMLWQCFQLYGTLLYEKPLLAVLWQLDSVHMH